MLLAAAAAPPATLAARFPPGRGRVLISVLHPTRGRPGAARAAREAWLAAAVDPGAVEWLYIVDSDDSRSVRDPPLPFFS